MTQYRIIPRDPLRTGRALDAGRVDVQVVAGSRRLDQREFAARGLAEGWIREMTVYRQRQGMAAAVAVVWDSGDWTEVAL